MERQFSSYETLFVVDLDLGDEGVKATIAKFTDMISSVGKIIDIADWGKRRLAYPINDKNEGYYTLVTFEAPTDFPAELNRVFSITEGIMRAVVTKPVASTAKPAPAPVAEPAPAVEAPAAAEETAVEAPAAE